MTALAGRRWFRAQAIGTVRRPGGAPADPAAFYDPWAETMLEILPRWADGLAGIEGYSHLVVPRCPQPTGSDARRPGDRPAS